MTSVMTQNQINRVARDVYHEVFTLKTPFIKALNKALNDEGFCTTYQPVPGCTVVTQLDCEIIEQTADELS